MPRFSTLAAAAAVTAVILLACDRSTPLAIDAAADAAELHRQRAVQLSLDLCAPDRDDFTLRSGNDYFPLGVASR